MEKECSLQNARMIQIRILKFSQSSERICLKKSVK